MRKYSNETGRFLSIDPLWEKYLGWTPYHYCSNNPINSKDLDGNVPIALAVPGYIGGAIAIAAIGWAYTEATHPGTTKGLADAIYTSTKQAVEDIKSAINQLSGNEQSKGEKADGNTNPYAGPVSNPVTVVDDKGNAIPVKAGEQIQGSRDGTFEQVKDKDGNPTGIRKDGPHGASHKPEGQRPHAHRPDVPGTNHWLDINP